MADDHATPDPAPAAAPPAPPAGAPPRQTRGRPFTAGNPGGGRKRTAPALRQRIARLGPLAVRTLEQTLRSPKAGTVTKLKAALEVIAHVLGRPTVALTGADGGALFPGGGSAAEDPVARLLGFLEAQRSPPAGGETTTGPGNAPPGANGAAPGGVPS